VGAGLERHVDRGSGRIGSAGPGVLDRRALAMQAAELGVETLADHLAVVHDHRADERVRAHLSAATLGELQGPAEVRSFLFSADRGDARLLVVRSSSID